MKNDLRDAFAVAQMDEDDPAQIAAAVDPSHQQRAGTRIFSAQLAASVGAAQVAQKIQRYGLHIQLLAWRRGAISARSTCSCSPDAIFFNA